MAENNNTGELLPFPEAPIVKRCYICSETDPEYIPDPTVLIKRCERCKFRMCEGHASKVDARYCLNCMQAVEIIDSTFTHTETEYDEDSDTLIEHSKTCRQIKYSGPDWVWNSKRIATLTDEQLKANIEYHRGTISQIEIELVSRTIKRNTPSLTPGAPTVVIKKTEDKKTVKTAKPKELDPNKIAAAIKNLGLTPEVLEQLKKALA